MPYANSAGVKLYYEEAGEGDPIVFVHEFGSDLRQWEGQIRWFSRQFRCLAFNARGYPPSDVPSDDAAYAWQHFADDIGVVMDQAAIAKAHIVGWSMGAYAALQFAMRQGHRASTVTAVGVGSGSPRAEHAPFQASMIERAQEFLALGMAACAEKTALGPTRIQLQRKDRRGWEAFKRDLAQHSPQGMAMTCRNYQGLRPSLEDFTGQLAALAMPVLIVVGDEDAPCIETSLMLKRVIPGAGLWTVPQSGHAPNLEDPAAFNRVLQDFIDAVGRGQWRSAKPA